MNVKSSKKNDRVYLCLNIITFLLIGVVVFLYNKVAFNETSTGVYYRKLESGNGKSIDECIDIINKEREKNKSNKNDVYNDAHYIIKVERCITYKGTVVEYPKQCSRDIYVYDYNNVKNNNYLGDYYECLNMLKNIGDRYLFKIKMKDAHINTHLNISEDDYVCIEMKLVDVFDSNNFYGKQIEHFQDMFNHFQTSKELDKEIIMRYLENIKREYSNVGDYFVVLDDQGRGERIKSGDKVKYNYYVKPHGGKVLNTNIKRIAEDNGIYDDKMKYEPNEIVVNSNDYSPLSAFVFFKRGSIGKIFYPLKSPLYIAGHNFIEVYIEIIDVKHEEKGKDNIEQDKKIDMKDNTDSAKSVDKSNSSNEVKNVSGSAVNNALNKVDDDKKEKIVVNNNLNDSKQKDGKKGQSKNVDNTKKKDNKKKPVTKKKDNNKKVTKKKDNNKKANKKKDNKNDNKKKDNKKKDNKKDNKKKDTKKN